jgi:hypothetical protein
MPGSTFRKLVLYGLFTFLAAVPAKAQTLVIGDFSGMTVGTVRPIRVEVHGGVAYYADSAMVWSNLVNGTSVFGFSPSPSGPFTITLEVPLPLDFNGNGTTAVFYFKALNTGANAQIQACTTTTTCAISNGITVTTAPPPPPPPPPPAEPSAVVLVPSDWLSVGSVAPLRLKVSNGPAGLLDTYYVSANLSDVMLFSLSANGPFTPFVGVPIQLNGDGDGQSAEFYVKGAAANFGSGAPQNFSHVGGCASTLPCLVPRALRLINVNHISWATYTSSNEGIDDNPRGEGKRIFVGKLTAGDTAASDRRKVRVRAQLSEPFPGIRVRFRLFDMDDPTTNDPELDPNGSAGDDNRGLGAGLSSVTALTDSSGQASVVLSVSGQPGDNFRVAASAEAPSTGTHDFLAGVSVVGTALYNGYYLDPTSTQASAAAIATPLLTVWRRLHIEKDTMGAVTGNYVTGTVTAVEPDPYHPGSLLTLTSGLLEEGRFQRGRIDLQVPGSAGLAFSYDVDMNRDNIVETATPVLSQVTGWHFTLFDDDDFNGDDVALNGDEGDKLPFPDMTLLADSDDPAKNKLAAAFIRPTYDLGKGFAPFLANAIPDRCHKDGGDLSELYAFDHQASEADPEYWTIYALSAYQWLPDEDADGDGDGTFGAVDDFNGKGFALFYEGIADYVRANVLSALTPNPLITPANIAVHEAGHLFWGDHGDGGIMDKESPEYSAVTLNKIRSANHP